MPFDGATLLAHADWSAHPGKRWLARARRRPGGQFLALPPEPAGETAALLARLAAEAGSAGSALVGFDFPIGLPRRYAEQAGIEDFPAFLAGLGRGEWPEFFLPAETPEQVGLRRPFYPLRPGAARRQHLAAGLGVSGMGDLLRACDAARPGRRAACPLFWTLGGQQVGKAAIAGWREVLAPALLDEPRPARSPTAQVALWPFAGPLETLLQPGRLVIAETYPAEFYLHLGIEFSPPRRGSRTGKRVQAERAANAARLVGWAEQAGVALDPRLEAQLRDGFGAAAGGEDPFDAAIGLLGMLNVVLGRRPPGEPPDALSRNVEGWILGQEPLVPGSPAALPEQDEDWV